jgi:hypothetical protein
MNPATFNKGHMVSVYHPAPGYTLGVVEEYEDGCYLVKMACGVASWFNEDDVRNAELTPPPRVRMIDAWIDGLRAKASK